MMNKLEIFERDEWSETGGVANDDKEGPFAVV